MEDTICDFFHAIEKGNDNSVGQIINDEKNSDVLNMENQEGKNALEVALESKSYDIALLLIENGFKLKTTLLRMIETDNLIAVTFLCKNKDMLQEYGQNILESPQENDEYTTETTPIMLAAEKNNYQIVKILLQYGASMPNFDSLKSKYDHLPTTQRTRIVYRYFNALTSEAYLLQTKGNLMTDIFDLFKQLKRAKQEKKGMNDEFTALSENLEIISKKVLDLTRNEDEVRCLLAGDSSNIPTKCVPCNRCHTIPPVVRDALLLNMKGFLAHDECQAALMDLWYQHFCIDLRLSQVKRIAVSVLLTILYPVLCILYIILPCRPVRRFMNSPFVKFTLSTASRMTFLGFLIFSTLTLVVTTEDPVTDFATDDEIRNGYLMFRNAFNMGHTVILFTWILGMSLREVNDFRRMGYKMYREIGCNVADLIQLALYWTYIIFHMQVLVQAHQTIQDEEWIKRLRPPTPPPAAPCHMIFQPPFPTTQNNNQTRNNSVIDDDNGWIRPTPMCVPLPEFLPGDILFAGTQFKGETRLNWSSSDPLLVAEATFALANVLTFGRLLQTVVMVSGGLGVLAISLTGMVGDIVKFLILFAMTLISFTPGMTQLYRPFEELALKQCQDNYGCQGSPAFISLVESMKTLFWALFGMNGLDILQIDSGQERLTESVGHFMYALYLLVAVIVLLNALIAMMSSTYAQVEENAEQEWKYCRSKMMTEYIIEGAVLPPPFNLIPDIWQLLFCLRPRKKNKRKENSQTKRLDHYKETNTSITKRYIYELQRQKTQTRLSLGRNRAKLI